MTSRERVQRCLRFQTPDRPPRQLWALPWFRTRYPAEYQAILARLNPLAIESRPDSGNMYEAVCPWGTLDRNQLPMFFRSIPEELPSKSSTYDIPPRSVSELIARE